jgi:histone H2A
VLETVSLEIFSNFYSFQTHHHIYHIKASSPCKRMTHMSKQSSKRGSGGKGKGRAMERQKPLSKSTMAGLLFPVTRIRRYMKEGGYGNRIGESAAVFLAAVLEYLAAEIVEISGSCAQEQKRKTINPRAIQIAIRQDDEFAKLLQKVTIKNGGVLPHLHQALMSKKGKKGSKLKPAPPMPEASQQY